MTKAPAYRFRPVTEADLPLLRAWRRQPHVVEWWGEPDQEDPAETLADPRIAMWIVELVDAAGIARPFAYVQDYAPHDWDNHPFAHLAVGSRGIDQYIGEPDLLDQGHGTTFIRQHVTHLLAEGAPAIGTDPHPDNARAIRACGKVGFRKVAGPLETLWARPC